MERYGYTYKKTSSYIQSQKSHMLNMRQIKINKLIMSGNHGFMNFKFIKSYF